MFEIFQSRYEKDNVAKGVATSSYDFPIKAVGLFEFFENYSDCSYSGGLYRTHSFQNVKKWNLIVGEAFPEFENRIFCFAFDWLGRQYALDSERMEKGEPLILMFEPGTGEVLEIPANFLKFHDNELVEYANEALATEFYQEWLFTGKEPPTRDQCVGYKKPLFLSGTDTIDNLEIIDLEVYWYTAGQLLKKVRGLSLGTSIDNITIE